MKTIAIAALASFLVSPVYAQTMPSAPRGWTKAITKENCTADKGLSWREADTFTSAKTGKVRNVSEGCQVDSKAARAVLYRMVTGKQ